MKNVLSRIIDKSQLAFLSEMRLLESIVVANEVVDEHKRGDKSRLIIKVDYEKAYNSVR